jgi:hypothetical protein
VELCRPRITVEKTIEGDQLEDFYRLYLDAFAPLRIRAAARQVLHRQEFVEEMADPRIWKYVAWNARNEPVGLSTLTNDLGTVPWISPEYFAARYPEHTARKAVYYWGFTLAQRQQGSDRLFLKMLTAVVSQVAVNKAVCAYDICAFNNATMHFGERIESVTRRLAKVTVEVLDSQTYYGAMFP